VLLDGVDFVEERDERLVSCFNEHELEGVIVEGNMLKSGEDTVEHGTTSNCDSK